MRKILRRYRIPFVVDRKPCRLLRHGKTHGNTSALRAVFNRVVNQDMDKTDIRFHLRFDTDLRCDVAFNRPLPLKGHRLELQNDTLGKLADIEVGKHGLCPHIFGFGKLQHAVHKPPHILRLLLGAFNPFELGFQSLLLM